jgi:LysR family glycine cleavage system transcriptional activator
MLPHGEALAAACQRSLAVLESALQRIAGSGDAHALNFNVPPTFAMKWLVPRLPRFQVRRPQIELRVSTSLQSSRPRTSTSRCSELEADRAFHAIPVLEERGMLVCSPKLWAGRPGRLSELGGMTAIELHGCGG